MPGLNCHKPEKSVAADRDGSKDEVHALTNDKFNVKKRTKTDLAFSIFFKILEFFLFFIFTLMVTDHSKSSQKLLN